MTRPGPPPPHPARSASTWPRTPWSPPACSTAGGEIRPPTEFDTSPRRPPRICSPGSRTPPPHAWSSSHTGVYGKPLISALDGLVASSPAQPQDRQARACQHPDQTDHADARAPSPRSVRPGLTDPVVAEHPRPRFDPAFEDLGLWISEFHRLSDEHRHPQDQERRAPHRPAARPCSETPPPRAGPGLAGRGGRDHGRGRARSRRAQRGPPSAGRHPRRGPRTTARW